MLLDINTNSLSVKSWLKQVLLWSFALHVLISICCTCFALQKLPEVLDLGDIDLDRKRLRKQLQVVRIRKLYLAAIYNTSFFFKEKKGQNPSHQHHVSHCFCRFPKKFRTWFSRTTRRTPGNSSEWWTSRGLYNTPLLSVPMAGGVSVFFFFFFIQKLMPMFLKCVSMW